MFVRELLRLTDERVGASFQQIKDLIYDINLCRPDLESLYELRPRRFLPIKSTNGQVTLGKITDKFAVIDHPQYGRIFESKVPVLDFDFEEIHKLRPFLYSLSLGDRFMSQMVRETSTADGSHKDTELSEKMREKSYAIFR